MKPIPALLEDVAGAYIALYKEFRPPLIDINRLPLSAIEATPTGVRGTLAA